LNKITVNIIKELTTSEFASKSVLLKFGQKEQYLETVDSNGREVCVIKENEVNLPKIAKC
jgi:hypothetical protein